MTLQRLAALQWFGLLGGACLWAVQLTAGFWITQATCNPGTTWGIDHDRWQIALLAPACALWVVAQVAAGVVFMRTRPAADDDPPAYGRLHFCAGAALLANVLFITMMLLAGIATVSGALCRGA
jgi:hypothetical protein